MRAVVGSGLIPLSPCGVRYLNALHKDLGFGLRAPGKA
jgi:hypothetical protein